MKKILLLFTLLIVAWTTANAYDFRVDGIAYSINSDGKSVTVTQGTLTAASLTIPEKVLYEGKTYSVTSIGEGAFQGGSSYKSSLTIPNTVTTIGDYAFFGCSGIPGSLNIPNSVTSIGDYVFYGCSSFTGSLNIPNSVTSIGIEAFYGCSGFKGSLTIPNSVETIGSGAFKKCSGFTGSLNIPNSVTSIGDNAFYGCSSFTGSLTIPNSVTTIEDDAFPFCTGFTSLNIPNSVTSIGNSAFYGCSGFKGSLNIPNSVTSIGNSAFRGCSGFTSLTIPNSVTYIGQDGFGYCSGFTGSLNIPNSITQIGPQVFEYCSGFTGLSIPNSVTTIGSMAFFECSGFSGSLNIPNSVTSIGNWAFDNCSGFTGSLSIPNSVETIGSSAFANCSGFKGSLTIPNSVTSIGNYAFYNCSGFTGSLTIGNAVKSIGGYAFYNCSGFTEINSLNSKPPILGTSCFENVNKSIPLYVPSTSIIAYKSATGWREFSLITTKINASSLSLNKQYLTLTEGQSETLVATISPSNATNKKVSWRSSNNNIATVDSNGNVTGVSVGTTSIIATTTDGTDLLASCQVTVGLGAKSVTLNKSSLTLFDGQSETLVATVSPSNAINKNVSWKSSNNNIATVNNNGTVTGISAGTVTITATTTDGTNLSATCKVTVLMKAKGISLNKTSLTLNNEQTETLVATVTPSNAYNKTVTWKSSNPSIATVDSNGKVTSIKEGTTIITATTTDGTNLSASCDVTVISNKLYIDTLDDFFGGEEIVVAVKMRNSLEITGFQTDIKIPEGCSFVVDEDGYFDVTLSDRATRSHSISATRVNSSTIRVLSYSNTSKMYSGNDGPIFYVKIISDWNAPIGNSVIELINTELAEPDGTKMKIENADFQLRCYYVPGDANHDKKVSISDIVAEARYILLQNPVPFHYKSANLNDDGEISVSDIVLTANVILGRHQVPDKKYSVQRMMGNDLLDASVLETRSDGSRTIAIALDNSNDYTAFQADLCLPEGMEIIGARLSERASRNHGIAINQIGNNTVRILSYASDNATYTDNSGDLLFLDVKGRGNIEMTNALFAEPNGYEHELDEMTFSTELSGINEITVGNVPINVYNMAGQLLRKNVDNNTATQGLPAGIYLVGNKKVVVK